MQLTAKYRPAVLADLLGQAKAKHVLQGYLVQPYSAAFLFHGPTGTGKTSAAYVLANELGIAVDEGDLGGWICIPSGELKADMLRDRLNMLRYRPLMGSGWKMLVCNEADRMNTASEYLFLDALENLPDRTVAVFTSNKLAKFSERFLGRCHALDFQLDERQARADLEKLVARIWKEETGRKTPAPPLKMLGADKGQVDFRSALTRLQPFINRAYEQTKERQVA